MTRATVLVLGHRFSSLSIEREVLSGMADVADGNVLQGDGLTRTLGEAHAVLLGTRARLDAPTIGAARALRIIVRYGIGTDNIAVEEATKRGVAVANVPDYCVEEVADHTVALLLAASRRLVAAHDCAMSGRWGTGTMHGVVRLSTQTLGLVGFGRIGQTVCRKLASFVARVLAYDPVVSTEMVASLGAERVELSTLLRSSDYVSLHCPLTPETRHVLDAVNLAKMKPQAWVINTSRGELIDETALVKTLTARRLGGAALDVLTAEPPPADHPLLALDNVLLTPHVAWYSEQAVVELRRKAAEQVRAFLEGGRPQWLINPEVVQQALERQEGTT